MIKKILLNIVLFILISTSQADSWINDWVDGSSRGSLAPDHFQGSKRGFVSGGDIKARFQLDNDYLFSVQKPNLSIGCGGIDLFMGSFSFLEPEYLMQKMQRALSAAPAIAFDMALKELCQECAATVGQYEGLINKLNSMQMSECEAAKKFAENISFAGAVQAVVDNETNAKKSETQTAYESGLEQKKNNNKPTQEQKEAIQGCSASFKRIFTQEGTLITNIAKNKGVEKYASYMAALVGDLKITYEDKQFGSVAIPPCSTNRTANETIDSIVKGKKLDNNKLCQTNYSIRHNKGTSEYVSNMIKNIKNKIISREKFTDDELLFMNKIPIDIYQILVNTVKMERSNSSATIEIVGYVEDALTEVVAEMLAINILKDLLYILKEAIDIGYYQAKSAGDRDIDTEEDNINNICSPEVIEPIIDKTTDLRKNAEKMLHEAEQAVLDSMSKQQATMSYNEQILKQIYNTQKINNNE